PFRPRSAPPSSKRATICWTCCTAPTAPGLSPPPSPGTPPNPPPGGCRSACVVDLLPAIDISRGRVVRLSQGEATRQTIYGDDPLAIADRFVSDGASWIHVV